MRGRAFLKVTGIDQRLNDGDHRFGIHPERRCVTGGGFCASERCPARERRLDRGEVVRAALFLHSSLCNKDGCGSTEIKGRNSARTNEIADFSTPSRDNVTTLPRGRVVISPRHNVLTW